MEGKDLTKAEFKTLMEMILLILEGSKDIEEAKEKVSNLTILKEKE